MSKVTVICDWCGKPISRALSSTVGEHKFCNYQCYGIWQSENRAGENSPTWKGGNVTVRCDWCGEPVNRKPSQIREHNFCKRQCRGAWRSQNLAGENSPTWKGGNITIQCDWCGESISRKPSQTRERNFCNRQCQGAWRSQNLAGENSANWQGGISFAPYHPNFNELFKEQIRQRDTYTCQLCDEPGNQVHHIYYDKLNDCHNPKDFITLCEICHPKVNVSRLTWIYVLTFKMAKIHGTKR